MTPEIAAVLAILIGSLVLFITEKLSMDVVALLVLGLLAVTGLVTLEESLAGFSNPAVVTIWAMFILSAGLTATGVADFLGRKVLALAGTGEVRMILVIMFTAGVLSAFMNNIGVAALMLPVVMDIARRTDTAPSRLLMPMAYASLLGGLTTMVGTPPNLVASGILREAGYEAFRLFEFAPIGVPALCFGALFMVLVGRHFLPSEMPEAMKAPTHSGKLRFSYDLEERRFRLRVAADSPLHGLPLKDGGLGRLLGLTVLAIERDGRCLTHIDGETPVRSGDLLDVQGSLEDFRELRRWQAFEMARGREIYEVLSREKVAVVHATLSPESSLAGLTIGESDFRRRFHLHILGIRRAGRIVRDSLADIRLKGGEQLLLQGRREAALALEEHPEFDALEWIAEEELPDLVSPSDALVELIIPEDSQWVGKTIASSGFHERMDLRIIGIARKDRPIYFPDAGEVLRRGDQLLAIGPPEAVERLQTIQGLAFVDGHETRQQTDHGSNGLAEVTLSPSSELVGRSLRDLDFRRRYGMVVLAVWRRGQSFRSHLPRIRLELGDCLLVYGPRDKAEGLADDSDFIVLTKAFSKETARQGPARAWISGGLMVAFAITVLMGFLPIPVAAITAAGLMVALRCLSMEDAYRAIEWKSVFLIAGMIPLGTAMQTSGAASWLAEGVTAVASPFGLWGILIALYLLTSIATTIVPTTALVLIMGPIAIEASLAQDIDPKLLVMTIAMAASASFTSPISHPANVLVMGPGGYRFVDFVRVGILLALVVMITVLPLILLKYG